MSFAPPELILGGGDSSARCARLADLYLLGSVLCELATGQGATAQIIPHPQQAVDRVLTLPEPARPQARRTELNRLYLRLGTTADVVRANAPPVIAADLSALFRQLCDPFPDNRNRRQRRDRNLPSNDLAWLLRRVDIHRIRLRHAQKANRRRT